VVGIRYLMAHDPTLEGARPSWGDWLQAAGQARVPGPGILLSMLRYIQPGHHPSTEVPTELGLNYLNQSPAVQAATAT
jgi:predicted metal-dependent hydrolase